MTLKAISPSADLRIAQIFRACRLGCVCNAFVIFGEWSLVPGHARCLGYQRNRQRPCAARTVRLAARFARADTQLLSAMGAGKSNRHRELRAARKIGITLHYQTN